MSPATRVRPAAVAGSFYPSEPARLAATVEALLAEAPRSPGPRPKALVVPHAGFRYSGPIAATAYATWLREGPPLTRILLLGPSHHFGFAGLALPGAAALATPLGLHPIDQIACARARSIASARVVDEPRAHVEEHALEVQLPFLSRVAPTAGLVPLVVGEASAEEVAAVLTTLWGGPETGVLISSDLSHYQPYDLARRSDARTAQKILQLDADLRADEACGARALAGLLTCAQRLGLEGTLLDLRSSGDTAGGREQVVGYGAFAFDTPVAAA